MFWHIAAASGTPSSLQKYIVTASFCDLPPSKIYMPAPSNMIYAKSHFDSTLLLSQIGYASASHDLAPAIELPIQMHGRPQQ